MDFGTQQCWPDGTNVTVQPTIATDRTFIKDLTSGSSSNFIIAVVISKLSIRSFPDKKNPGTDRYTLGFTIRDSATDFINVTCWGCEAFITDISKSFKINDIIEIRNPHVTVKQASDYEQQWKPWTPSNYQLNVSESHSTVSLHAGWNVSEFNTLQHTPIKESGDFCCLADIISSGQNIHGDTMNVLVIVKNVGTPKDIVTKKGKNIQKCDIQIFDDTCPSFQLTLWDEERIELASTWTPGETILFIADLKIVYNDYIKTMASVCTNKTIFTVDPDIRQAQKLYNYSQSSDVLNAQAIEGNGERQQFSLEGIEDVYTLEEVKGLLAKGNIQPEGVNGIIYGYVTNFNIDENVENVVSYRCGSCRKRVNALSKQCENPSCSNGQGEPHLTYDIMINISDQTGTLTSCRLVSSTLEAMLGYTPEQFKQLPLSVITEFKFKYLLEKCKLYFRVTSTWNNSILVMSCTTADSEVIHSVNT